MKISNVLFIIPNDTFNISIEEKNDLASLKNVLTVSGIRFTNLTIKKITAEKLSGFNIVFVPFVTAKNLNGKALRDVLQSVKSGSNIFTDGPSMLSEKLGIILHEPLKVNCIRDSHFSADTLYWTIPAIIYTIDNTSNKDSVLSFIDNTRQPIAVSGIFGKGHFIMISTFFDPNTRKGYSRFPFLIEWLQTNLSLSRITERQVAEMYFDPGNRKEENLSIDTLVKVWSEQKIKRIYAAGWYNDGSYDYTPLFKACHSKGIQVYCWLEPPEINNNMWKQHPEWREKTATGLDAHIDWRKLMNLADEKCIREVFNELDDFLMKYQWDGVNFAEMYFEPNPAGFNNPAHFTPMNNNVRNDFEKISGFDPIQLFDSKSHYYWKKNSAGYRQFANYRKKLSYKIKCRFLDFLTSIKKRKKDFDVMLTGIDVSLQPEESDNIGESTENTLALYNQYNITLQIEDPSGCWGSGPERYLRLGEFYRKTVKEQNKLVFDCNVVGSHEKGYGGFPSEKPSGEEIRQVAYNMSLLKIRPAFYSEDALNRNDYKNISSVFAREASIIEKHENEWEICTPYMVQINIGRKDFDLDLDQKRWLAGNGCQVIIPRGKHILKFSLPQSMERSFRLKHISGELIWADFLKNKLEFEYSEEIGSCYVIIDKKPKNIYVDNQKKQNILIGESEYVITFPQGKHIVKIE